MNDTYKALKKLEDKWGLFIAITHSNPNDWYCNTLWYNNLENADRVCERIIDDYIDLYIECNSEYPEDLHHRNSYNDWKWFYFDKFTWYLDWDNIKVRKSIFLFDNKKKKLKEKECL